MTSIKWGRDEGGPLLSFLLLIGVTICHLQWWPVEDIPAELGSLRGLHLGAVAGHSPLYGFVANDDQHSQKHQGGTDDSDDDHQPRPPAVLRGARGRVGSWKTLESEYL